MTIVVDLNADLGETEGDLELIGIVTSANVACGAHAGDEPTMRAACAAAFDAGTVIGAHPGYPDRAAMGRAELGLAADVVVGLVVEQVSLLAECALAAGGRVRYVKPHGALYHRAGHDRQLAASLVEALLEVDAELAFLAQPGAALLEAAAAHGAGAAAEGYCDRAYLPDGGLVPRGTAGAVHSDPERAAAQATSLAARRGVTAVDGSWLAADVRSLCVHGDTPGAAEVGRRVRAELLGAGVRLEPFVA